METQERRSSTRRRVLKAASLSFGHASTIDCVVKNLSDRGALLAIETPVGIPDQVVLVIPSEQIHRKAVVVWRRAKSIGVSFESE